MDVRTLNCMTNKQASVVIAEVVWSAFAPVTRCSEVDGSLLPQRACLVYEVSSCDGTEVLQHNCVLSESVNFAVC